MQKVSENRPPPGDVIVCGGGASGYAAAIAAGRMGARVLLIERAGFLGGSLTQALVTPWMTFHAGPKQQIIKGIAEETVQALIKNKACSGHIPDPLGCASTVTPVEPEAFKRLAYKMCAGAGVEFLLDTVVCGALKRGRRVEGVVVECRSGRRELRSKTVIDCTGDADVAALAGAPHVYGREQDNLAQPMTLIFIASGVDGGLVREYIKRNPEDFVLSAAARRHITKLPYLAVSGFFSLVNDYQKKENKLQFRDRVLYFEMPRKGTVAVNMTRVRGFCGTRPKELSRAYAAGIAQVSETFEFLRAKVPGFGRAKLSAIAEKIGVRETRHIHGDYTLSAQDVLAGRKFSDEVAYGAFPIDIHSPDGKGLKLKKMVPGTYYGVPFRCMLPSGLEGLLVCGRAISATHEASASARLSPTCVALGEAAGTAAAIAALKNTDFRKLDIKSLKSALRKNGAFILTGNSS